MEIKMNEKQYQNVYGCSQEQIENLKPFNGGDLFQARWYFGMLAMSILSDAQDCLELTGDIEKNRKLINRAKYIISTYLSYTHHPAFKFQDVRDSDETLPERFKKERGEEEKCNRCGKADDGSETYFIANDPVELICRPCIASW
jgi:hypothetical protein